LDGKWCQYAFLSSNSVLLTIIRTFIPSHTDGDDTDAGKTLDGPCVYAGDRETERKRDREEERQRGRETERNGDREEWRQRGRETERHANEALNDE